MMHINMLATWKKNSEENFWTHVGELQWSTINILLSDLCNQQTLHRQLKAEKCDGLGTWWEWKKGAWWRQCAWEINVARKGREDLREGGLTMWRMVLSHMVIRKLKLKATKWSGLQLLERLKPCMDHEQCTATTVWWGGNCAPVHTRQWDWNLSGQFLGPRLTILGVLFYLVAKAWCWSHHSWHQAC